MTEDWLLCFAKVRRGGQKY